MKKREENWSVAVSLLRLCDGLSSSPADGCDPQRTRPILSFPLHNELNHIQLHARHL